MHIPALTHYVAQLTAPNRTRPGSGFTNLPTTAATGSAIQTIMTIVFTIMGAVAVIIIVIGGIKYSSSQGDPQAISKAKGTIIYAVIGLIVCIFATAIVQFGIGHI